MCVLMHLLQVVQQVLHMLDGMKAMAMLKLAGHSPMLKHLEALSYKADGPFFTLSWRGAVKDIVQTVKTMRNRIKIKVQPCPADAKP